MPLSRSLVLIGLFSALTAGACTSTPAAAARDTGGGRGGRGRGADAGLAPVVTAKATERDVPIEIAAIGNVEASTMISVRSQVTGQLEAASFHEGDFVRKGQPLFAIDRRPFETALAQAEANVTRDRALLAQAEAQLMRDAASAEYQQLTAERQLKLADKGIVAKDDAEQSRAQADATSAVVKADRAAIDSARAQLAAGESAVDTARVQLGYTAIRSPIDGRTGNLAVKVGNLVTANQTELMTIAQVEPVLVTFTVPAVHLATIKAHLGGDRLPVTAAPQDGNAQTAQGSLTFVDNVVDTTTDTIKLKASFTNSDRRLWPGQFARVSLRLETLSHATVVPSQAVQTGQDGQYVFVVKPDSTVDQRPIVTAQRVDQDVVVDKGLKAGETVVTEGQLRLEPGTRVTTDLNAAGGGGRAGRGGRGKK